MCKLSKKALVVISFGTSYAETRARTIEPTEALFAKEFLAYDIYRAFTSKKIISKLRKRDNILINNPEEVLKKLMDDNYEEVILQPLLIINGYEYESLVRLNDKYQDQFKSLVLGNALLTTRNDYESVVKGLQAHLPELKDEEAIVFMGHGTEHHATSAYMALEYIFDMEGNRHTYVGTIEGFPDLSDVIERLQRYRLSKVYLIPFMFVSGDHAINDMAGEQEDSWKCRLEKLGYKVEVILQGLGELDMIRNVFIKHAKETE